MKDTKNHFNKIRKLRLNTMGKSQKLYKYAKTLLPGGTQLLSKRPEMFLPELWPAYYSKAKGCTVWDLDFKKYIDMSYMGIGACVLGYSNNTVDEAVIKAVKSGNMSTLNAPEEVKLAEVLIDLHPWAEQARYARTGGEAMAIAVRLARAATGNDKILFCGYHGWHDWYLAANLDDNQALDGHLLPGLKPKGVPRGLLHTAIPFRYNDLTEFIKLFTKNKTDLAAVVMEPIRNDPPKKGFLEYIRDITKRYGVVLIFDEVTSGFRLAVGGAHLTLKINPDIAVLGKALSNGFPMAAIIGRKKVLQYAQESFISSTYWTDRSGPAAALATIKVFRTKSVVPHLVRMGKKIQDGWINLAKKHQLDITVKGIYPLGHFEFNYANAQAVKTLFVQLMLRRGYLATNAYYASLAHTEKHIEWYLKNIDAVFAEIREAIMTNTVENKLAGPVAHTGFKRLI